MSMWLRRPRKEKGRYEKRIRWTTLKREAKRQEFKTKVLHRMNVNTEGAQGWWKTNAKILRWMAR